MYGGKIDILAVRITAVSKGAAGRIISNKMIASTSAIGQRVRLVVPLRLLRQPISGHWLISNAKLHESTTSTTWLCHGGTEYITTSIRPPTRRNLLDGAIHMALA